MTFHHGMVVASLPVKSFVRTSVSLSPCIHLKVDMTSVGKVLVRY